MKRCPICLKEANTEHIIGKTKILLCESCSARVAEGYKGVFSDFLLEERRRLKIKGDGIVASFVFNDGDTVLMWVTDEKRNKIPCGEFMPDVEKKSVSSSVLKISGLRYKLKSYSEDENEDES
jgi:hypothetical protein